MRISDWSSDVCSSDLFQELAATRGDVVPWERTGSGGLLRAGMDQFDVSILDRMLGDIDAQTILRRLRESGRGRPVLLLSGLGGTSPPATALAARAATSPVTTLARQTCVTARSPLHARASDCE